METMKQPAMILSTANTVAIIGIAAYFFRKTSALEAELLEIKTNLQSTVNKVKTIPETAQYQDIVNTINRLGSFTQRLEKIVENNETAFFEESDAIQENLELIASALDKASVPVRLVKSRRKTKRGGRKGKNVRFDSDEEKKSKRKQVKEEESDESESESEEDVSKVVSAVRNSKKRQ